MAESWVGAEERLLSSQEVAERFGVSVATLWRLVEQGQVPEPVRYSRKLARWKKSLIDACLANVGK